MPVIAIVGAGPGLGIQIAHAFGRKGFAVAMVARNAAKLDALVAELHDKGIDAAGFVGDINKPDTITEAFAAIKQRYGKVDVLEYSPADPTLHAVGVLDVDPGTLQPQIDFYIGGALHTVRQVAADMIAAKSGTILITTGGGSITPVPALANINIAAAGLRNWTLNLHNELKPHNIYVAHIAISAWIGAGHPGAAPDVIAACYPELYETRAEPELHYVALDK
ncbi:SDR family NAD(P)-dependent oxidoreductase [Phytohabitans suffuscus]|uniref:Short-chain dehydrogenase n=1 Tax=Phytohabitans suffuscus TaxID=624315 RepID=A0A6F8YCP9_9ACTN|nr:SDR family NAD(P)-dependent oxidoreductase [Phytohabitans suffuscus]BCB83799.1 short-chain dehydrogenase [Phytohabitans suffuscus]